jgi:stromal membrane-associated protein
MMLAFLFRFQDVQEFFFLMQIGMIEFIGILNVKVIGGTNLAIRDMSSSDPYVVLTLGHQKAQTSVIKGNLNPVWNEELKLSVPRQYGPLKLVLH